MNTVHATRRGSEVQGTLLLSLRLLGWLTVNVLCTLGCLMAVFLAIGSFTVSGTMLQLANLSTRYVAADMGRQSEFNTILLVGGTLFFCATAFFRRASVARALKESKH